MLSRSASGWLSQTASTAQGGEHATAESGAVGESGSASADALRAQLGGAEDAAAAEKKKEKVSLSSFGSDPVADVVVVQKSCMIM